MDLLANYISEFKLVYTFDNKPYFIQAPGDLSRELIAKIKFSPEIMSQFIVSQKYLDK